MKNAQLKEMKAVIQAVKETGSNKFKLPLILNEMKIDEHLKALEELNKPSKGYNKFLEERQNLEKEGVVEGFQSYKQERNALLAEHAEIDAQGALVLYESANGQGQRKYDFGFPNIVKEPDEFTEKDNALAEKHKEAIKAETERLVKGTEELAKKHKKAIEAEDKRRADFAKTLEEEADIELRKIPFDDLPEMSSKHLEVLMPIIAY
jgi:hypothetical protein